MTRRYAIAALLVVAAGAALGLWARRPPAPRSPDSRGAGATETVAVRLVYEAGRMSDASAPAGAFVHATIENHDARPLHVTLAGYEHRLPTIVVEPGGRWSGGWLADRPGDDFAWLAGDRPVGRFRVTGSHLIEGHR